MDATTTAIFTATGISATQITAFLSSVFGQGLSFGIYVVETVWPYVLVAALLYTAFRVGRSLLGMSHH